MENKSLIVMVLDRSGSMECIRDDTIGGVNTFIEDQRQQPGTCNMTMVQFDHEYELVYQNMPLQEIEPLNRTTFRPRGSTALLDALGRAINTTAEELSYLSETNRPDKVIFVIMTDGYENCSTEYGAKLVNELVTQKRKEGWEFIYLGANQDAIKVAQNYGIPSSSSLTYTVSTGGTQATYAATSSLVSDTRRGNTRGFTSSERNNANQ